MKFYSKIKMSPWSHIVAIGSMMLVLIISACTDVGDRNNINDYDGDSYAYGDDLYYLNRDGKGFDGEIRQGQVAGNYFIYDDGWRAATEYDVDAYDYEKNKPWEKGDSGEIRVGAKFGIYYIYDNGWRRATDFEKDTYQWLSQSSKVMEGTARYGEITKTNCYAFENGCWRSATALDCMIGFCCIDTWQDTLVYGSTGIWYICDKRNWRVAKDYEKDTYGWNDATEGTLRKGDVTGKVYVFENSVWRLTRNSIESTIGICIKKNVGLVECVESICYICDLNDDESDYAWRFATNYERDTYGWRDTTEGALRKGNISNKKYVYDGAVWREANEIEGIYGVCNATIADSVGSLRTKKYICQDGQWQLLTE